MNLKPGDLVGSDWRCRHKSNFVGVCPTKGERKTGLILSFPEDKDQERGCCQDCADYWGPIVKGPTVKVLWAGHGTPEYYCARHLEMLTDDSAPSLSVFYEAW